MLCKRCEVSAVTGEAWKWAWPASPFLERAPRTTKFLGLSNLSFPPLLTRSTIIQSSRDLHYSARRHVMCALEIIAIMKSAERSTILATSVAFKARSFPDSGNTASLRDKHPDQNDRNPIHPKFLRTFILLPTLFLVSGISLVGRPALLQSLIITPDRSPKGMQPMREPRPTTRGPTDIFLLCRLYANSDRAKLLRC
jgi:hypothetical protein